MSHHLFDKHIKEQLENFASPVPEGMWDKIVQEKKRRPVMFWWNSKPFLVFALLTTISTFGIFILYQQTKVETTDQLVRIPQLNNLEVVDVLTTNVNIDDNQTTPSTKQILTVQNNITLKKELRKSHQAIQTKREAVASLTSIQTFVNSIVPTNTTTLFNNPEEYEYSKEVDKKESTTLNTSITNNSLDRQSNKQKKVSLLPVSVKPVLLQNKLSPTLQYNIKDPIGCPEDKNAYLKDWYLETYLSPELTFKQVTGSFANNVYLAKKDSAESMRGGFTFGARISKHITQNILLKAGVQFSQLNEVVKLRRENERRMVTVVTIRTVTDAFGNTTTIADTSTITQIGYVESTAKNYYRNIELPLALSYEFGNKSFKAAINGGIIMNIASWYSGKVLDTAYQLVNVSPKENDGITKHNVALSLYGSISLIKPITDNMDLFAEPYFRYNLSKLQNTAYNFSQRFSATGISLGIRYKLNK